MTHFHSVFEKIGQIIGSKVRNFGSAIELFIFFNLHFLELPSYNCENFHHTYLNNIFSITYTTVGSWHTLYLGQNRATWLQNHGVKSNSFEMTAKKEEVTALLDSDFSSDSDSVFGDEDGITQVCVCVRVCACVWVQNSSRSTLQFYYWQQYRLNWWLN